MKATTALLLVLALAATLAAAKDEAFPILITNEGPGALSLNGTRVECGGSASVSKVPETVGGFKKGRFEYRQRPGDLQAWCRVTWSYEDGSGCQFQFMVDTESHVIYHNYIETFLTVSCSTENKWPNMFFSIKPKEDE